VRLTIGVLLVTTFGAACVLAAFGYFRVEPPRWYWPLVIVTNAVSWVLVILAYGMSQ